VTTTSNTVRLRQVSVAALNLGWTSRAPRSGAARPPETTGLGLDDGRAVLLASIAVEPGSGRLCRGLPPSSAWRGELGQRCDRGWEGGCCSPSPQPTSNRAHVARPPCWRGRELELLALIHDVAFAVSEQRQSASLVTVSPSASGFGRQSRVPSTSCRPWDERWTAADRPFLRLRI